MSQVYKDEKIHFEYIQKFISKSTSDKLLEECDKLDFTHNHPNQKPRRTSITFGDDGLIYTIRVRDVAIHRYAAPWSALKGLTELKERVEKYTKLKFNFCAILRYVDGTINIRKHRDKEMTLGTSICGISIGDSRTFQLTPPDYINIEPLTIELANGSMYIMHPPTNSYWMHEILSEENKGMRYSFTFRNVPSENIAKEIPVYPRCEAILKSGEKKGEKCGVNVKDGLHSMCKRHRSRL